MRRFELREGTSSKFWEIEIRRTQISVRFGRIGTEGQTRTKKLASTKAAIAELVTLVAEKKAKGYREVRGKKVAARPPIVKERVPARATRKPTARAERFVTGAVPASEIAGIWARIERVLVAQRIDLQLRPPASAARIAAAERALGVVLPDDFRASLAVHDGQEDDADVPWLPIAHRLGSLDSIVACWKGDRASYEALHRPEDLERLDPTGRVRQVDLHPQHVPIAGSRHWDYDRLMLDAVPGPRGTSGQVIGRSDADLVIVAETFGALLADVAARLEDPSLAQRSAG